MLTYLTEAVSSQYPDHVVGKVYKRGNFNPGGSSYYGYKGASRGATTTQNLPNFIISKVSIIDQAFFFLKEEDAALFNTLPNAGTNTDIIASNNVDVVRVDDDSLDIPVYMLTSKVKARLADFPEEFQEVLKARMSKPAVLNPFDTSLSSATDQYLSVRNINQQLLNYYADNIFDSDSGGWKGNYNWMNQYYLIWGHEPRLLKEKFAVEMPNIKIYSLPINISQEVCNILNNLIDPSRLITSKNFVSTYFDTIARKSLDDTSARSYKENSIMINPSSSLNVISFSFRYIRPESLYSDIIKTNFHLRYPSIQYSPESPIEVCASPKFILPSMIRSSTDKNDIAFKVTTFEDGKHILDSYYDLFSNYVQTVIADMTTFWNNLFQNLQDDPISAHTKSIKLTVDDLEA